MKQGDTKHRCQYLRKNDRDIVNSEHSPNVIAPRTTRIIARTQQSRSACTRNLAFYWHQFFIQAVLTRRVAQIARRRTSITSSSRVSGRAR
ncbi:hypothetical protein AYI68_g5240 [Smittium mucronatum]|uniref:Uncharacterized protein n=1 Tax=Smittium mucronatum TaxID=133383 RepID=A0A1R0GUU8_9FUNG|nr:hypothetical protein AYI68_g5240 [Smittium mucronatum]